jgi:hypothetical protein
VTTKKAEQHSVLVTASMPQASQQQGIRAASNLRSPLVSAEGSQLVKVATMGVLKAFLFIDCHKHNKSTLRFFRL